MSRQSSSLAPLTIICFALLLPAAYPLSYLALSNHVVIPATCTYDSPWRCSDYRLGGDFSRTFYRPLEGLDQWARPTFWNPSDPRPRRWSAALEYVKAADINVEETSPEFEFPGLDGPPGDGAAATSLNANFAEEP